VKRELGKRGKVGTMTIEGWGRQQKPGKALRQGSRHRRIHKASYQEGSSTCEFQKEMKLSYYLKITHK
jgi:hypothetical protein